MKTQSVSKTPCNISYYSISKGASTLKAILKLYGVFYDISDDDIFKVCPLLIFIESLVYEADTEIEDNQNNSSALAQLSRWNSKQTIIQSLLRELNLEHPTIVTQLEKVGEYVKLENKLVTSEKITYEDVVRASELRTGDFRVLHCTLIQMLGKPYRPEVFELMLPREVLLEFADDLDSYKEDVAVGNYNTYWMFEKLYGEEAHQYLQVEIERYRNLFEEKLKQLPEKEQEIYSVKWSSFWQKFSYLSSAELIRKAALEGCYKGALKGF